MHHATPQTSGIRALGRPLAKALAAACIALTAPAWSATYSVTTTANAGPGSLRDAIQLANASGGANTIDFAGLPAGSIITLASALPPISSVLTIDGGTTNPSISGNSTWRIFFVYSGSLDLRNMNLILGRAKGGDAITGGGGGLGAGGALFVNTAAAATLTDVSMTGNSAVGGSVTSGFDGGGGGGMEGKGGDRAGSGGLGGIGAGGGGGNGAGSGGGFGGTLTLPGAFSAGPVDGAGASHAATPFQGGDGGGGSAPGGDGGDFAGGGGAGVVGAVTARGGAGGFGGGGGGGGGIGAPAGQGGAGGFGGGGGANGGLGGTYGGSAGAMGTGVGGSGGGAALGGAIFVRSGGSLTINGGVVSGGAVTGGNGVAGIAGGTTGGNGSAFARGIFLHGSGILNFNPPAGATVVLTDDIADGIGTGTSGGWGINKAGAGTLVLSGTHNYRGATSVTGGMLVVTGSYLGSTSVQAGATLSGNGTIGNTSIDNGGTLAPGPGAASMLLSSLQMAAGATYVADINGTVAGTQYDQVKSGSIVDLNGATLVVNLGFTPAAGSTFTIIDKLTGGAVVSTFAGLPEGGTFTAGGNAFRISYVGGTGNDVVLTAIGTQTITFGAQPGQTYAPGGTFAINPVATASSGLAVTYASSTTGVCTVSGTTVTIVSAGNCTITADQPGDTNYAAAPQVAQTIVIAKSGQTIAFGAQPGQSFTAGGTFAVNPLATASSGLAVTYGSSTTGVCTVSGTTVTIVSAGNCTITADQTGDANYNAAPQATQTVVIAKAGQTITFGAQPGQSFTAGGTFAVNPLATASSGLTVTYGSSTTGVCTVSGSTVTIVSAGNCTITANQAGDANYNAAPQATQTVVIAKAGQTITFGAQPGQSFTAGGTFAINPLATASSGLTVTYGSSTTGVCTVSGTTVTMVSSGSCVITADQGGSVNYNPAPQVTQAVAIGTATQTITFAALSDVALGAAPFTISATASSGLTVTFTSTTPGVCTATGASGALITVIAAGTCTIRADQAGNASYLAAPPVTRGFNVTTTVASGMVLNTSEVLVNYGTWITLSAQVANIAAGGTVTFAIDGLGSGEPWCVDVPVKGGLAQCVVPGRLLKQPLVSFTASYSGDGSTPPATAVQQQLVRMNSTTLSATAQPAQAVAGRSVTLRALVVAQTIASPVTFRENGVALPGCTDVAVKLLPGVTDAGVAVCTLAAVPAGAHTYVVTYSHAADAGFEQVYVNLVAAPTGPADATDMWWAGAAENGWGVSITQHGTKPFVVLYVYDAAGKPVWYVLPEATWNAGQTAFTGNLYLPSSTPFDAYDPAQFRANVPVGTATVAYAADGSATLTYTIQGVSGTKTIRRQAFAGDDGQPKLQVGDLWWGGEAQNGWGLNIAQQGRMLFPVWYTYDAEGKASWFALLGGTWSGTTFTGDIYKVTSSAWLGSTYDPAKVVTSKVGTLSLDFQDQTTALMSYTVNGKTQRKVLVRQPF